MPPARDAKGRFVSGTGTGGGGGGGRGSVVFERFEHNWAGYRAILRSDGVRADLQRRADAVAQAARSRLPRSYHGRNIRILADTTRGRNRAGATVIGVPMRLEKALRILGSSIDAARR